jgi:hypothetical protein
MRSISKILFLMLVSVAAFSQATPSNTGPRCVTQVSQVMNCQYGGCRQQVIRGVCAGPVSELRGCEWAGTVSCCGGEMDSYMLGICDIWTSMSRGETRNLVARAVGKKVFGRSCKGGYYPPVLESSNDGGEQ